MVKPRSGRSPLQPFIQAMVSFKDKLNFHWILLWKNIRITGCVFLTITTKHIFSWLLSSQSQSQKDLGWNALSWSRFRPELDTNILRYYDWSFTHPRVIDNCYLQPHKKHVTTRNLGHGRGYRDLSGISNCDSFDPHFTPDIWVSRTSSQMSRHYGSLSFQERCHQQQ